MNSLYGKFGQNREKEQIVMFPKDLTDLTPMDFFGETPFYLEKKISKAKHILPAIAAFVTCYARLRLYSYMEKVQELGGEVYYCDTDSIVTDVVVPCSLELGDLKDEIPEGIEKGVFLLPKMYALKLKNGEYIRCKGFPKFKENSKKETLFGFSDFEKAYDTKDMSGFMIEREKFALPFESMRRNKTFVSMMKVTRKVISQYDKRTVLNNLTTSAIKLCETLEDSKTERYIKK